MTGKNRWTSQEERAEAIKKIIESRPKIPKLPFGYAILPEKEKELLRASQIRHLRKTNYRATKKWQENNPKKWEKIKKTNQIKQKIKSHLSGKVNPRRWGQYHREELFKLIDYKCQVCGELNNLEIHHKQYTNNLEDLAVLCKKCHMKIHRKRDENGRLKEVEA